MIGLFSVVVELLLSSGTTPPHNGACGSFWFGCGTYPTYTTMPRPAFTWLACDTAIRLNSTDLCHLIISSYYYSFFRAFERYFLTVNRKIFILFTFNAIMQIVKSKLHSFQI